MAENNVNNKPNIETLKKVQYSSLMQFLEDINRNFAIIENSPFYKGLPGNPGDEGNPGGQGIRGSVTVFVRLSNFNKYFQNTIISASNINIDWLNLKLKNSDDKIKLLQCFDINTFVHGDIIVLTNTLMLSYNAITEQFIDTGIAFNEQSQIINNLDKKIEDYVKFYVDNNISIKNLKTIFAGYDTYAKNFGENNSVFITTTLTNSSIYAPYIEGVSSTQGTKIETHRYWGLVDEEFGKDETGTIVFGSMKKYIELLMKTTLTDGNETLTSDYAPGINNIPAAVFLQDTPNNGIMVGWKNNIGKNLRRFGLIFKNEANELVLQSDAGNDTNTNGADYSSLYLHKDYMRYKKLAKFENNIEVSRDAIINGNINNIFIKTGLAYAGSDNQIIIGLNSTVSRYKNISKVIALENFKNKVIVTDSNGLVLSNYVIEKGELNQSNILDNNKITTHVGDNNGILPESYNTNILTTNYFSFLAKKINNLITYIGNNFYKKSDFNNGTINETIKLGGDLEIKHGSITGQNMNLSGSINMLDRDYQSKTIVVDANTGNVILGKIDTSAVGILTVRTKDVVINSLSFKLTQFKNKLLVTDSDGLLSSSYSLLTDSYSDNFTTKPVVSADTSKILTSLYLKWLVDMIYSKTSNIQGDYFTKADFVNNSIPILRLNGILRVGQTLNPFFIVNQNGYIFNVGKETEKASITFNTEKLTLIGITKSCSELSSNHILSINNDGIVSSMLTDLGNILIGREGKLFGGPSMSYEIVTGNNFRTVVNKINDLVTIIGQLTGGGGPGSSMVDYVLKQSLTDYSIGEIKINGHLDVRGTVNIGGEISEGLLNISKFNNVNAPNGYFVKISENFVFGRPIFSNNPNISVIKEGTRILVSSNSIVNKSYQPSENHFSISSAPWGELAINDIPQNALIDNGVTPYDENLLVTFNNIREIVKSINVISNLVSGSGNNPGIFYTKNEMFDGLPISAKFAGVEYNLGNSVYCSGGSTYIGETANNYFTYINNDLRLIRHTNLDIVSTDSFGKPISKYNVSTRPDSSVSPTWNVAAELFNLPLNNILLTTNDASYLIKTINTMKTKMVELDNASKNNLSSADVNNLIWKQMPIGMIIGWADLTTIPAGWFMCNGQNGTINLQNRLIKADTVVSGMHGGNNSVKLSLSNMPIHYHTGNTGWDGIHTHFMSWTGTHTHGVTEAGDQRLDNVEQIRIGKSNSDYVAESGRIYTFACSSNGGHIHDIYDGGNHSHTFNTEVEGNDTPFNIDPEYVTLIFIQKISNV